MEVEGEKNSVIYLASSKTKQNKKLLLGGSRKVGDMTRDYVQHKRAPWGHQKATLHNHPFPPCKFA